MAIKIIEKKFDDIDGTELNESTGETVSFALDGTAYEIDLTNANAGELRAAFAPYIEKARKAGVAPKSGKRSGGAKRNLKPVREWLRSQGHEISTRGRIPEDLIALYDANN